MDTQPQDVPFEGPHVIWGDGEIETETAAAGDLASAMVAGVSTQRRRSEKRKPPSGRSSADRGPRGSGAKNTRDFDEADRLRGGAARASRRGRRRGGHGRRRRRRSERAARLEALADSRAAKVKAEGAAARAAEGSERCSEAIASDPRAGCPRWRSWRSRSSCPSRRRTFRAEPVQRCARRAGRRVRLLAPDKLRKFHPDSVVGVTRPGNDLVPSVLNSAAAVKSTRSRLVLATETTSVLTACCARW